MHRMAGTCWKTGMAWTKWALTPTKLYELVLFLRGLYNHCEPRPTKLYELVLFAKALRPTWPPGPQWGGEATFLIFCGTFDFTYNGPWSVDTNTMISMICVFCCGFCWWSQTHTNVKLVRFRGALWPRRSPATHKHNDDFNDLHGIAWLWLCMALHGLAWPCMALALALHGLAWLWLNLMYFG